MRFVPHRILQVTMHPGTLLRPAREKPPYMAETLNPTASPFRPPRRRPPLPLFNRQ